MYATLGRLIFCMTVLALAMPIGPAAAQVTNGDFSLGSTGWTSFAPGDSTVSYAGNQLTSVSNDNGVGTDIRTYAAQSLTTTDPGFLTWRLVSYIGTDVDGGFYDYPHVVIGSTFYWINTGGGIQTTATGAVDNDDSGITNLTVRTTLTAGTRTIGAGVTAQDSIEGAGTAIWDDIDFQELTQSPSAQIIDEDTTLTLSGGKALQVATNSGAGSMSVTISVTNGVLALSTTEAITITAGANNSATITFNGTPAAINTALDGLQYTPTAEYNGSDTLVFAATGGGLSDTDNIGITINAVPDYSFTIANVVDTTTTSSIVTLNYTTTVTSTGDTALTSPIATQSPAQDGGGLTLTSGPTLQAVTDTNSNGEVDPGEAWQYLSTYTVTQANLDNGEDIIGTATFDADSVSLQSDGATTSITENPSLSIAKSADVLSGVNAGDTITYTYVVTNNGNQTISAVSVADVHNGSGPVPAPSSENLTLDTAPTSDSSDTLADAVWDTLAPGDEVTFTATYVVTQNDVDTLQ